MSKDGGPAYPCQLIGRDSVGEERIREQFSGMSLRDYFAAKAMQAMLSNPNSVTDDGGFNFKNLETAYEIADAMLKERDK